MSKALKKLIDINGLREFKNKLVGTDSAYVQTGAVDQTIAGTKTFSKPIAGSVTGSSGSCTGNAASATNATYANWLRTSSHTDHLFHTEWDNAGYFWTYVTAGNGEYRAVRVARSDSSGNADTATTANSVPWSGVTGKPSSYTPSSHTHDDRYYTESEVNNLLGGKANTSGRYNGLHAGYADTASNGVDSGGNGWIRFKNGIQICWKAVATYASGSSKWTYSASFSSDPVVTVCDYGSDTRTIYLTRAANIGTTSCVIVMVDVSGGSYAPGEAQCIAIGRWK